MLLESGTPVIGTPITPGGPEGPATDPRVRGSDPAPVAPAMSKATGTPKVKAMPKMPAGRFMQIYLRIIPEIFLHQNLLRCKTMIHTCTTMGSLKHIDRNA